MEQICDPKALFCHSSPEKKPFISVVGNTSRTGGRLCQAKIPRNLSAAAQSPDTRRRPAARRNLERWAAAPQAHNIYSLKGYKWQVRTASVSAVRPYKCLSAERAGSEAPGQLRGLVLSHLAVPSQPKTPSWACCIPCLGASGLFSYKHIPKRLLHEVRRLSHQRGSEVTN